MKARVVFDHVGWLADGRRQGAERGQVIDLPNEEFDRLAALGAVTTFAGGGKRVETPEAPEAPVPEGLPTPHKARRAKSGLGNR